MWAQLPLHHRQLNKSSLASGTQTCNTCFDCYWIPLSGGVALWSLCFPRRTSVDINTYTTGSVNFMMMLVCSSLTARKHLWVYLKSIENMYTTKWLLWKASFGHEFKEQTTLNCSAQKWRKIAEFLTSFHFPFWASPAHNVGQGCFHGYTWHISKAGVLIMAYPDTDVPQTKRFHRQTQGLCNSQQVCDLDLNLQHVII